MYSRAAMCAMAVASACASPRARACASIGGMRRPAGMLMVSMLRMVRLCCLLQTMARSIY
ncbi:MAG: hypothetical protein A3E01_05250 [Gammaproteobacteria bacterium RIFCSPHIGHO2_12_FULL_63_22]|nr:MAG: hypothetical protein A3E01_05250 [Gammaproteobacteria bacterium RIFCSPHIGHO2_12_FULL_63_22]